MVVLIAGAPTLGNRMAQSLLEQKGYPYLSIDLLKMGLNRSGQTNLSPEDDAELTEYLWPIVPGDDQNCHRKPTEFGGGRRLYSI